MGKLGPRRDTGLARLLSEIITYSAWTVVRSDHCKPHTQPSCHRRARLPRRNLTSTSTSNPFLGVPAPKGLLRARHPASTPSSQLTSSLSTAQTCAARPLPRCSEPSWGLHPPQRRCGRWTASFPPRRPRRPSRRRSAGTSAPSRSCAPSLGRRRISPMPRRIGCRTSRWRGEGSGRGHTAAPPQCSLKGTSFLDRKGHAKRRPRGRWSVCRSDPTGRAGGSPHLKQPKLSFVCVSTTWTCASNACLKPRSPPYPEGPRRSRLPERS